MTVEVALTSGAHVQFIGTLDFATLVAFTALVVSTVALVRPWSVGRRALFDMRIEVYHLPARDGRPARESRLVLHNNGPASAKQVTVIVLDQDGKPYERIVQESVPQPIPVVQPGQSFHWIYGQGLGGPTPTSARVQWRDGRLQAQSDVIWLGTHIVV